MLIIVVTVLGITIKKNQKHYKQLCIHTLRPYLKVVKRASWASMYIFFTVRRKLKDLEISSDIEYHHAVWMYIYCVLFAKNNFCFNYALQQKHT